MKDLPFHLALFAFVGLAIVSLSSFYAESDDRAALRGIVRRFAYFAFGCTVLVGVILFCESFFASLG